MPHLAVGGGGAALEEAGLQGGVVADGVAAAAGRHGARRLAALHADRQQRAEGLRQYQIVG